MSSSERYSVIADIDEVARFATVFAPAEKDELLVVTLVGEVGQTKCHLTGKLTNSVAKFVEGVKSLEIPHGCYKMDDGRHLGSEDILVLASFEGRSAAHVCGRFNAQFAMVLAGSVDSASPPPNYERACDLQAQLLQAAVKQTPRRARYCAVSMKRDDLKEYYPKLLEFCNENELTVKLYIDAQDERIFMMTGDNVVNDSFRPLVWQFCQTTVKVAEEATQQQAHQARAIEPVTSSFVPLPGTLYKGSRVTMTELEVDN